jgi:hypothetical protein
MPKGGEDVDKKFEGYSFKDTIISRSPSTNIRSKEELLKSIEGLSHSMEKNLNILSKWFEESEEIMPRPKR